MGSQRCKKNIGALARNAINKDKDHQKFEVEERFAWIRENSWDWIGVRRMFKRRGKEAVMVYIRK